MPKQAKRVVNVTEIWDVYDKNRHKTGKTMVRDDWHMTPDEYHISVLGVIQDAHGRYLITQRKLDKPWGAGWWEFPGGKIENGETPEKALVREIREELAAGIKVEKYLTTVEYDYPVFHLSMDCFWCSLSEGHLTLLEHEAAKWLPLNDLRQVNWLPADVLVVEAIEGETDRNSGGKERR